MFRIQSDTCKGNSNAGFKRPVYDCKLLAGGFTSLGPAKNGQILGRTKQVGDRSIRTHLYGLMKDSQIAVDGHFS